jgi:hypothetical protein
MNIGHIIYPLVLIGVVLLAAANRQSLLVRIVCVVALALFIFLGLHSIPHASARGELERRESPVTDDFRDGVLATVRTISRGHMMIMVPILALAAIALIPLKPKKRGDPTPNSSVRGIPRR